ncbi:6917_t:CDS:2 [Dentiscutata erythropus]|uniref:6917_t:CDS:1 n=1 Tax=Dentiscutata erythropus TaxID=1348616 RepID=A0A9N9FV77_9GLOM|nr:6917_t:CDS:2 [Dentiscutata erythropus]
MSTGTSIPSMEMSRDSSLIETLENEEPGRCYTSSDSPSGIPVTEPSEKQPVDQQQRMSPKKPSHAKKLVDKFATFSPMRNKGSDRQLIVETYSNYNGKKDIFQSDQRPKSAEVKTQKKKKRATINITEGMSKADIFAANVASAIDAADDSDEEEVYYTYSTSNSRTPSLTSLNGSIQPTRAPISNPNLLQDNNNIPQQFPISPHNVYNAFSAPYRTYNTFPHRSHFPAYYNNNPESNSQSPNSQSPNPNNKPTGVMRSSLPDMSQYVKALPNYAPLYNNWYVNDERYPLFAKMRPPTFETHVNIKDITNVLAADKELMFDIQVKGRNFGLWDVEIIETDLNVFATPVRNVPGGGIPGGPGSHWDDDINPSSSFNEAAPRQYLGTILAFDEPLTFPSGINRTGVVSTPTGQVRLRNPGGEDKESQEKWSFLLRHQFDLTVRGVLKYTLPFSKSYVASVCFAQRVDGSEESLDKDGKSKILDSSNINLILGCGDWEQDDEK